MPDLDDHAICDLTTIGRVTGRPHTIEIWFAGDGDTVYLLSGGRDRSDWVRNLMAHPEVVVGVDEKSWRGRGRVISNADQQSQARWLVYNKYQPGYAGDLTEWRDTALPICIDLA